MVDWAEYGEPEAVEGLFALLTHGLPPSTVELWTVDMPPAVRFVLRQAVEALGGPAHISTEQLGSHMVVYRSGRLDEYTRLLARLAGVGGVRSVRLRAGSWDV